MHDLPDLALVAFRIDDPGDHPGGGHCVSLSRTEAEGTRELVEQYLARFGTLLTGLPRRSTVAGR